MEFFMNRNYFGNELLEGRTFIVIGEGESGVEIQNCNCVNGELKELWPLDFLFG